MNQIAQNIELYLQVSKADAETSQNVDGRFHAVELVVQWLCLLDMDKKVF